MKSRQLLVYIGAIVLLSLGNIYCSEQVAVDVVKSEKQGVKRSAPEELLSERAKKQKADGKFICPVCDKEFEHHSGFSSHSRMHRNAQLAHSAQRKSAKKAIIAYKHLHCTEPRGQMKFFIDCERNGWVKGEGLDEFVYTVPEDYDYCPLREKSNCPYLIMKKSIHNSLQQHMKTHHKAEYDDAELKAKYIPKQETICSVCAKVFKTHQHLKAHLQVHAKKSAFVCSVCNKGFKSSKALVGHSGRMHRKAKDQSKLSQSVERTEAEILPPSYAQAVDGVPEYPSPEYPFAVPSSDPESQGPIRGGGDPMLVIDDTGE